VQSGTVRSAVSKYADPVMTINRSKVLQVWFAVVALVVVSAVAFGVTITLGTGVMLLAFCLVPPAIIVMLWPEGPPPTVAEVLHRTDRRI